MLFVHLLEPYISGCDYIAHNNGQGLRADIERGLQQFAKRANTIIETNTSNIGACSNQRGQHMRESKS